MARQYFQYSRHKTREAAEASLEDDFADGVICEAEAPYIEPLKRATIRTGRVTSIIVGYAVMFPAE